MSALTNPEQAYRDALAFFGMRDGDRVTSARGQEIKAWVWDRMRQLDRRPAAVAIMGGVVSGIVETTRTVRPPDVELREALERSALSGRFKPKRGVGPYVIDFAFVPVFLGVMCDARDHKAAPNEIAREQQRDTYLSRLGWVLLRFTTAAIRRDVSVCVARIERSYVVLNGGRG